MEESLCLHCTAVLCLWPSSHIFLSLHLSVRLYPSCHTVGSRRVAPQSRGSYIRRVMMLKRIAFAEIEQKKRLRWCALFPLDEEGIIKLMQWENSVQSFKNSEMLELVQCVFRLSYPCSLCNGLQWAFLHHSSFLCHPPLLLISVFTSKWLTMNSFFSLVFTLFLLCVLSTTRNQCSHHITWPHMLSGASPVCLHPSVSLRIATNKEKTDAKLDDFDLKTICPGTTLSWSLLLGCIIR